MLMKVGGLVFVCVVVWFLVSTVFEIFCYSSTSVGGGEATSLIREEMNHFRAVFVTVPNIEVAKKIANGLVSNKLAACVNIIPQVTSVYEWEGKINEDSELILMIKSQESLFSELEKFVKDNHPYSVPEVIALPIQQGSQSYLDWISQVTKKH